MSRRRSSFCSGGDCVWVELLDDGRIGISSCEAGDVDLVCTPDEWSAFVAAVKNDEFDLDRL